MKYKGKALRHEVKYMINKVDYEQLKSKLTHIMGMDGHTKDLGFYHIRSLYFDDHYGRAYYEKEDGVFQRKKYRIRIYNHSDHLIRLELKEKFDKYISKESTVISKATYEKIIANQLTHEDVKENSLLLKFYVEVRTNRLKPRIIVDYIREPFVNKQGNVRITFDRHLQTVLWGKDLFSDELGLYSVIGPEQMILEVKYNDYIPRFIDQTLSMYHQQIMSASKYVMCCDTNKAYNWKGNL